MRIEVLGCSGGVGPDLRTTSLLVDDQLLIDAGSGVGDLSQGRMARISQVFLTHSHLDHICGLPFMADNLAGMQRTPVDVYAIPATLDALRKHVFNWVIWPDFTELPNKQNPVLQFKELNIGSAVETLTHLRVSAFPVSHTVPAVGYSLAGENGTFAFSGDTAVSDSLWKHLNALPRLNSLMIEVTYPDEELDLAVTAGHFTPSLLAEQLGKLRHHPRLLLTHHKPGAEVRIQAQCRTALEGWDCQFLKRGDVLFV